LPIFYIIGDIDKGGGIVKGVLANLLKFVAKRSSNAASATVFTHHPEVPKELRE